MVDGAEREAGMSERAIEFVEVWVSEHVRAGQTAGDAKALAAQCLEAAKAEGIPQSDIKDAFEDLAAFIAGEIQEVNTDRGAN
jgi:phosphohistidine phosphatase SixA